jgi:ABC-type phosphate/phosphonate transport system permease subunit
MAIVLRYHYNWNVLYLHCLVLVIKFEGMGWAGLLFKGLQQMVQYRQKYFGLSARKVL